MFKKFVLVMCALVLLVTVTGCGKTENIEGELPDLMSKINSKLDEEWKSTLISIELDEENKANYLGTNDISFKSAIVEEHMTGSVAYSVILIRAEENADIEAMKTKIKENINPRKWVCVWVEEDDVIIKNKGDLIIVIMVENEDNRNIIENGFDNL